jgi:hypothetical protein
MSEVVMSGTLELAIFAVASFVALIVISGAWTIQSFVLRCKASKLIDNASRATLTLAFIFKSNHVTKIMPCKVHANGYLETLSTSKKDPKHYIPILRTTFTRPTIEVGKNDAEMEQEEKDCIKEATEIATLEKEILTPTAIEGTNCRAYLVYDGVACAVTAEALVGLGVESQELRYNLNPNNKSKAFLNICLNVNPQLVKKHLTKLYDQSTVDGFGQDKWQEGWAERGKTMGEGSVKMLFLAGFGLCIVGCALMVAAFFL